MRQQVGAQCVVAAATNVVSSSLQRQISGEVCSREGQETHVTGGDVLPVAADDAGVQHDELQQLADLEAAVDLQQHIS